MDYLVYVEHSAENLQFYLWYQDYVRRWKALSADQRALSPELQADQNDFPNLTKPKVTSKEGLPSAGPRVISRGWNANGKSFLLDDGDEKEVQSSDTDSFSTLSAMRPTTCCSKEISAQTGLKWQFCMRHRFL